MKKKIFVFISFFLIICILSGCNLFVVEEPLEKTTSPNGTHTLIAVLVNGGATVDYSVKVYLTGGLFKKVIYNKYHQKTVTISWIEEDIVKINGITLDLSKGETYDWRKK